MTARGREGLEGVELIDRDTGRTDAYEMQRRIYVRKRVHVHPEIMFRRIRHSSLGVVIYDRQHACIRTHIHIYISYTTPNNTVQIAHIHVRTDRIRDTRQSPIHAYEYRLIKD